ncbi:ABC transporter substrate-binding protein [Enterococcus casseliflavus]|uniref:ABC transporter substrate-binding protein n=1 Tax=Enterococcus casseliflavus TaxID=37734 RepID=UPI003D14CE99
MKKQIGLGLAGLILMTGCGVKILPTDENTGTTSPIIEKITTTSDEKVTLNIVDWSDSTKEARKQLNQRFEKDHPNVTINYTTLTQAQFNETILSGIRSGNAPDLFPLPSNTDFQTAVSEGWFVPLNTYLDDNFFQQLKPEALQQNITQKDDDVYLLPEAQEISSTLMFYNRKLLTADELQLVTSGEVTWQQFREICQRVTKESEGSAYGIITSGAQKNRVDLELRAFSELAGAPLGSGEQIFVQQGKTMYASEAVRQAFGWYQNLMTDGSFYPDSASLTAPEARNLFAEGKAAFIVQGSWCIPAWESQNSQLDFDVMPLPVPETSENSRQIQPFTKGWMGISATSKHPDMAAEYLKYLYSYEYQNQLVQAGGFVSIRSDLTEKDISNERMQAYYRLAVEQSRPMTDPITQDDDLYLVYNIIQPVQPDFGDIAAGLLTGEADFSSRLKKYNDQVQLNLELAVDIVAKDSSVTLEDFEIDEP